MLLNCTVCEMANVSRMTMVMFTRLLEIRMVASRRSESLSRRYACAHRRFSLSVRSVSMSSGVRPKKAISLPETNPEMRRHTKAIMIMATHAGQPPSGTINSIAEAARVMSPVRGEDGKGSVSNWF